MKKEAKIKTPNSTSEKDFAKKVVEYFRQDGWNVYQEVRLFQTAIADIVCERDNIVHIIEVKKSLTFSVIAQARGWSPFTHYSSIAVPNANKSNARKLAFDVCRDLKIGVFLFDKNFKDVKPEIQVRPQLRRNCHKTTKIWITSQLHEGLNKYEAGGTAGGYWTPFKQTVADLTEVVMKNPGCTLKEAVAELKAHHYSSDKGAYSSMSKFVGTEVIPEIRIEMDGNLRRLH